jgi:hypothetical protein
MQIVQQAVEAAGDIDSVKLDGIELSDICDDCREVMKARVE